MSELFDLLNMYYNICSQTDFSLGAVYKTNYGLRSLRYFAPKICNMIPVDIRSVTNLSDFTVKIQSGILDSCPYNLYRAYICQVGYIK